MPRKKPDEAVESKQAEFIALIIDGGTWRSARDELKIGNSTIAGWMQDPAFREQYARACDVRADALFEEMLEIADDGSNDWMERRNSDGTMIGWQENGEALRRSALRIDARKWMLGKMKPKVYGDKVTTEHSGPGGGDIIIRATIGGTSANNDG
jgi:hypothetical protein